MKDTELEADNTKVADLQVANATERERVAELERQLATHAGVTSSHQQTIAWLKTQADTQAATIVDLTARLKRSASESCEREHDDAQAQIRALKDTITVNASECERHVVASNKELHALRTANTAIAAENLRLATAGEQLRELHSQISSLKAEVKKQTSRAKSIETILKNSPQAQEGTDSLIAQLNKANARIAELDGICQAFSNVRHVEMKREDAAYRLSVQLQTAIADRGKMHSLLKECQKERSLLIKALGRGV